MHIYLKNIEADDVMLPFIEWQFNISRNYLFFDRYKIFDPNLTSSKYKSALLQKSDKNFIYFFGLHYKSNEITCKIYMDILYTYICKYKANKNAKCTLE